jgi:hypothetical protein
VGTPDKPRESRTDPKAGRNPGYAEDQARSPADARQPAIPSRPTPDEAGMEHKPDAQPDPAAD